MTTDTQFHGMFAYFLSALPYGNVKSYSEKDFNGMDEFNWIVFFAEQFFSLKRVLQTIFLEQISAAFDFL